MIKSFLQKGEFAADIDHKEVRLVYDLIELKGGCVGPRGSRLTKGGNRMRRILLLFVSLLVVLATVVFIGGSESTFADGGTKDKTPKPPAERVLRSEVLLDDAGKQVGKVELVAHDSVATTQTPTRQILSSTTLATTASTMQRTCWVEFKITLAGIKVVSYKLYTKFNYIGGGLTYVYPPWVSASTSAGWSGGNYQKGWYWTNTWWSATSWATGDFTLKVGGWTVKSYHTTIGINFNGAGSCSYWGYW